MYRPIKELGQNFLTDPKVVDTMVAAVGVGDGPDIIEIGPGHGALTRLLLKAVKNSEGILYAVEIDNKLADKLEKEFSGNLKIKILNEEIKDYEISFYTKSGQKRFGMLSCSMVSNNHGQEVGIAFILHDITEQKELNKKLLNSQSNGLILFAANVDNAGAAHLVPSRPTSRMWFSHASASCASSAE